MSVFGIYQHHERTLQADLEADLIDRESGFADDNLSLVFFSNTLNAPYHFYSLESLYPAYLHTLNLEEAASVKLGGSFDKEFKVWRDEETTYLSITSDNGVRFPNGLASYTTTALHGNTLIDMQEEVPSFSFVVKIGDNQTIFSIDSVGGIQLLYNTFITSSLDISGNCTLSNLTASEVLLLDAGKQITSSAYTGTGNFVRAGSPTLTGTIIAAAVNFSDRVQISPTTGTNSSYQHFINTGGSTYLGNENSSGGDIFSGTTAYASVFGNDVVKPIQFVTNNAVRVTISGTDGAMTLSGTLNGVAANFSGRVKAASATIGGVKSSIYEQITAVTLNSFTDAGDLFGGDCPAIPSANLVLGTVIEGFVEHVVPVNGGGAYTITLKANGTAICLHPVGPESITDGNIMRYEFRMTLQSIASGIGTFIGYIRLYDVTAGTPPAHAPYGDVFTMPVDTALTITAYCDTSAETDTDMTFHTTLASVAYTTPAT